MIEKIFEVWKDIKGYEGLYQVSNCGKVKSFPRKGTTNNERILKPSINRRGYLFVILSKNGVTKCCRIHRLVAETFIENINNYPVINHIDGNKTNNYIKNLEWCTYSENNIHALKTGLRKTPLGKQNKTSHKILQIDKESHRIVNIFYGIGEIKRILGLETSSISKCCRNIKNYKTAYGYEWKYEVIEK